MKKSILIISVMFIFLSTSGQSYKKQVEENNKFAFDLYKYLNPNTKNLFVSPFSISTALAMTYEGAKNKTQKEMSKVMHFPKDKEKLSSDFRNIFVQLSPSKRNTSYKFTIANSLWAQKDFKFFHNYFETIKKNYKAPVELVDYKDAGNREKARLKINAWTEKKTNRKIKNLLTKPDLDKDTKLVLVNAVYFLAEWKNQFKEKNTFEDKFYSLDKTLRAKFMKKTNLANYYENDEIQVVAMPYANRKASMIVFLPKKKDGIKTLQKKFTNEYYSDLMSNLKSKYEQTEITFPKFKTNNRIYLGKILFNAGMKQAFTSSADFTDMVCRKEIKIDKIIHQTFIDLDENGTEAAAATAVVMKRETTARPSKNVKIFKAEHPFIYIIRDNMTGSILFMGQMLKPENVK